MADLISTLEGHESTARELSVKMAEAAGIAVGIGALLFTFGDHTPTLARLWKDMRNAPQETKELEAELVFLSRILNSGQELQSSDPKGSLPVTSNHVLKKLQDLESSMQPLLTVANRTPKGSVSPVSKLKYTWNSFKAARKNRQAVELRPDTNTALLVHDMAQNECYL